MSFLPAEELNENDYNSDDGYTGDEDFLQPYLSMQNYESAQEKLQGSKAPEQLSLYKSDATKSKIKSTLGSVSFPESNNRPRWKFGTRDVSSNGYTESQKLYSVEDLKISAIKGNIELVKKCLTQGMPVNQPLHSGWTALMYASNNAKHVLVEYLLGEGADANCHSDLYSALMCACSATVHSEEDVLASVKLLIDSKADINAKDRYHSTPLMMASRAGKLDTVKFLVDKGVELNAQDSQGWTALTMATQKCHKAVVMALLDAGADVNIRHRDKLTVKDLAAHLTTDEMLALLERRPYIASDYGDNSNSLQNNNVSNHSLLDSGDGSMKSTDLRYGELELFLYGLDLPHLLPIFRKQLIDLSLMLTLTEQDLTNAGVEQVGARKKILDASHAVHKRNWEAASLVSIHFNKCISCADAVAMIANASKQMRYISSTSTYIKEQIKRHPDKVLQPTDRVNPSQLMRHVEDSLKNVNSLKDELSALQSQLRKDMSQQSTEPVDLIGFNKNKAKLRFIPFSILCISLGTIGIMFWKRNWLLDSIR